MMLDVNGVFEGFSLSQEFAMPVTWQEISRRIDNLAEYKVVEFVLWITWGDGRAGTLIPLTYEAIAEYTGLSKPSIASGIERAIEHGYIDRQIEYYTEGGRVRSTRYYGLKLYQPEINNLDYAEDNFFDNQESLFSAEVASEAESSGNKDVCFSSNEFELPTHNNISGNVIRIQETNNLYPCKGLSRDDNATLCHKLESLSVDLGDGAHIASNVGQAKSILAQYITNGGNFEAFLLLLLEAKALAHRRTNIRRPNKMPYFFACLRTACSSGKPPAELQEAS